MRGLLPHQSSASDRPDRFMVNVGGSFVTVWGQPGPTLLAATRRLPCVAQAASIPPGTHSKDCIGLLAEGQKTMPSSGVDEAAWQRERRIDPPRSENGPAQGPLLWLDGPSLKSKWHRPIPARNGSDPSLNPAGRDP